MSNIDYKEVPENFIQPDEDNLPIVYPTEVVAPNEETHVAEDTELDELAEEITKRKPGAFIGGFSILLSIVPFMFILGIPFSIISVSQARKAKKSSMIGIVGFILNIIALLVTAFLIIVLLGWVEGLNEVCTSITGGGTINLPDGNTYTCPMYNYA